MTTTISVANQKGGVGKTTSAVNLAAELALSGKDVLLIDFDPQGNATSGLGVQAEEELDLFDLFFGRISLQKLLQPSPVNGLLVIPSSPDLIGLEIELGKKPGRELILKSELSLLEKPFHYVIIDCPPSSGLLTLNALGASEHVIIPLQAEYYALEGLSALLNTIEFVKGTFNPGLDVLGVFLTMFDQRTILAAQVEDEARKVFGEKIFETKIPRNIKLSECPSHGLPIALYDPASSGAKAYRGLAKELLAKTAGELVNAKVAANT